ncbi:MAG TPA: SpaA isopeptide-forming pilin-related protein [Roseiflexaceae bacterium]|nr:SpaA isopeptide-forming pilin-related protein [Roseiflexaceae bacterium]
MTTMTTMLRYVVLLLALALPLGQAQAASSLVLLVSDLNGAPVAGVVFVVADTAEQTHTITTNTDGQARVDGLPGDTVWLMSATFQGAALTMDTNDRQRGGLRLPLIVGGEQRLALDMAEGFIGVAFAQPQPAQPWPTNTPEPTRTPQPATVPPTNTAVPTESPALISTPTRQVALAPAITAIAPTAWSTTAVAAQLQTLVPGEAALHQEVARREDAEAGPQDAPQDASLEQRRWALVLGGLLVVAGVAWAVWRARQAAGRP